MFQGRSYCKNEQIIKYMAKIRGSIVVNVEKCKGCEVCMVSCPTGTIAMAKEVNGKGYNYAYPVNPELCNGCANCAMVCPDGVITVYKTKILVGNGKGIKINEGQ